MLKKGENVCKIIEAVPSDLEIKKESVRIQPISKPHEFNGILPEEEAEMGANASSNFMVYIHTKNQHKAIKKMKALCQDQGYTLENLEDSEDLRPCVDN